MPTAANLPRLEEMISLLLEQQLTPAESRELTDSLEADAAARATYRQLLRLHVLLNAQHAPARELSTDRLPVERGTGPFARAWQAGRDFVSQPMVLSSIVSALVLANLLLALALVVPDWKPYVSPAEESSVEFVAYITATHEATFDKTSGGNFQNRELFADDRILLKTGLVEITYNSGARVVLHAPASYQLHGPNAGNLSSGKLLARVDTREARGFAVDIPGARIVDLGTEFAVEVSADRPAEVAVFAGNVELLPDGATAGSGRIVRLTANQTVLVDSRSGQITRSNRTTDSLAVIRKPWHELLRTSPHATAKPIFADGFENPVLPANTWRQASVQGRADLAGSAWKFSGGAGISRNFSEFQLDRIPAPEGNQHALIQGEGSLQRTVEGFSAGSHYTLSLRTMARQGFDGGQDLEVILDAGQPTEVVLLDMGGVSFARFVKLKSPPFAATKESYELTIRTTLDGGRLSGDRTTLIDEVVVMQAATPFPD